MRRTLGLVVLAAVLLSATACGDANEPGSPTSGGSIELTREGGIAGAAQSWAISADGAVVDETGTAGQLDPEAVRTLVDRAAAGGFFAMDAEYLPEDPCCDRFTYRLTIADGERRHSVTTMDGVDEAPRALWGLIEATLELVGG